jgi:hypothetical protein
LTDPEVAELRRLIAETTAALSRLRAFDQRLTATVTE